MNREISPESKPSYKYVLNSTLKSKYNIVTSFFEGKPKVEILGHTDSDKIVEFIDIKTNAIIHSDKIHGDMWSVCSRQWYTDWKVIVKDTNGEILHETLFDLNDKIVYIAYESKSIGDTLAWFPYVEEFRKKHNCQVICSTFWNDFFRNVYKDIEFVEPGTVVDNIYVIYRLGWFYDVNRNPNDIRTIPLQQTATDILGLEYKEIKPRISIPDKKSDIEGKYVCIAIQSTSQCKYWNWPNGWDGIVRYLKSIGYKVVCIDRDRQFGIDGQFNKMPTGVIDKTGNIPLTERMVTLKSAAFFIGIGSGISWLSWSVGTPVIMISSFSKPFTEFKSNCIRLYNNNKKSGYYNNLKYKFDASNWNWNPIKKCKSMKDWFRVETITPKQVKNAIDIMKKANNKTSLKIGIQFLAYNCEKSFKDFISPWIKLKDKYDLYFFVGSVQFTLYKELGYSDKNKGTIKMFKTEYNDVIDYLYSPEDTKAEEQVRNKCLKLFKEKEIDIMWAVDSDEFFTEKEVENIIKFIKENEEYNWYQVKYKNYIGDGSGWIDFEVPRIWRINRNSGISHFYRDCWIKYNNGQSGHIENPLSPWKTIPEEVARPRHMTWVENYEESRPSNAKAKIEYQIANYGKNWGCSFKWDDKENKLSLDEEWYKSFDIPMPEIYYDKPPFKIGIQILAYNCKDTFEELIKPWIELKDKYDIKIWVGSGQFKIYSEMGCENLNGPTIELLKKLLDEGKIDYLFQPDLDNLLGDFDTRDKCIPWMRENDIDLMVQVDADEFYGDQAGGYLEWIMNNQDSDCYNSILKGVLPREGVFDDWERFSAAWIKRNGGISNYYFDCHWSFLGSWKKTGDSFLEYRLVNTTTVPKEICNPIHYSWNNDLITSGPSHIKDKIKYQQILYGKDYQVQFEWDEENQKLVYNRDWLKAHNKKMPELYSDNPPFKIGIQILAYNCEKSFPRLIEPWLKLKEKHNFKFWVGSKQFTIYKEMGSKDMNDGTVKLLKTKYANVIDCLYIPENTMHEQELRNVGLDYCKKENVELLWILDSDEFYTEEQIDNAINYVKENTKVDMFGVSQKNCIREYTPEDECFTNIRAIRMKRHGGIQSFYFEAYHEYEDGVRWDTRTDHSTSSNCNPGSWTSEFKEDIPREICFPEHFTWTKELNTCGPEHIKEKIEYQKRMYAGGGDPENTICGYEWDEENQKLVHNRDHYTAHGIPFPNENLSLMEEKYINKSKIIDLTYDFFYHEDGGSHGMLKPVPDFSIDYKSNKDATFEIILRDKNTKNIIKYFEEYKIKKDIRYNMNVGPRYELISIIKEIEIIFKDEQGNIVFEKTVSNEALNQKYKKIKIQTSYNQGLNLNKNSLINKDVYQEMRKIIDGESHGDDGNLEGMGLIYYSIVNLLRPKNVLCIGSGDGYIPCIMRQSQRDLNIDGKTFLVDADLPEVGYGGPAYLEKNSALRTAYPEIEIITEMSDKAYENIFKYIELDYIHIDADHSYEGVKSDFYNYVNCLSENGIITLHDTRIYGQTLNEDCVPPKHDDMMRVFEGWTAIPKFLEDLRRDKNFEIINFDQIGCGTAIIKRKSLSIEEANKRDNIESFKGSPLLKV